MDLLSIQASANGNDLKEMELLGVEINAGTKDMEVYTRLSSLYRKQRQWIESFNVLDKALQMLKIDLKS